MIMIRFCFQVQIRRDILFPSTIIEHVLGFALNDKKDLKVQGRKKERKRK
jgi:hypothetical protein